MHVVVFELILIMVGCLFYKVLLSFVRILQATAGAEDLSIE